MDEGLNIIGDVAGQYRTLVQLLSIMPPCKVLLLGDLVDRGPQSRKVVSFVRSHPDYISALMGNHEHMMVDFILADEDKHQYDPHIWLVNGGGATIKSYLPNLKSSDMTLGVIRDALFSDAQWMSTLPLVHKETGLFCSHAPANGMPAEPIDPYCFTWNRGKPYRLPFGPFMVHGHNSRKNVLWYKDPDLSADCPEQPWGVNIDTSQAGVLTGMHWPSKQIFQQEYVE